MRTVYSLMDARGLPADRSPAMDTVLERIQRANAGRDPERLKLKLRAMKENVFSFFRGTAHLFADDWPVDSVLNRAPLTWISGDLHLENFGTFKGDNRLEYFDINDFDEAVLASCTCDLARLSTSVWLAAQSLGLQKQQASKLCRVLLQSYAAALQEGKSRWVERETATGMVKDLLRRVRSRKRKDLLESRTELRGARRRIRVDGIRALPASSADRERVKSLMAGFAARQAQRRFFRVIDIARRIAGTGSLGMERWVILVEGKGSPNRNYLLDLKAAASSCWQATLGASFFPWRSEADRVVSIQKQAQAIPAALLQAVDLGAGSYVLRELQPVEDRLALRHCNGKLRRLEKVLITMAQVTAWDHLRSAGRRGASSVDELVAFGASATWQREVLEHARHYSSEVRRQWREFCKAPELS